MNYGHPLEFGSFVTPGNAPPQDPVGLATRSEELGYDLVTFQDHPYQPKFHDMWTLLSWVAGQTSRIRLAPNVINLPLRTPSVLARAAASLDLLSGGRLELALGAGGFSDAARAMGATVRPPRESIEALSQAIDVIRELQDLSSARPARAGGEFHRVVSAQRGPAPAHAIPIWVGAAKPRMLRLVGEKADGWLPSLPYVGRDGVSAGNKIIDEAAVAAGREPADIRRLLNISGAFRPTSEGFLQGPPAQWIDELLPLILEDGVGTLILMTDSAADLETFATEVMPALRDAAAPLAEPNHKPSGVRSKRRPGIGYDEVPASLARSAVEPGDVEYSAVRSNYMRGGSPGLVLRPSTPDEVAEALRFAAGHRHLPFGVRSGGHGISGRSTNDGGIVLDLGRFKTFEVLDSATRLVRIGAGLRWMEVAAALAPHGWALTSGDYGGVGVGGLTTAGGIGWMTRKYGLTLDHVRAATVVLADGSVVRASTDEHPGLFWALRGAGANFGVVTDFDFRVDEVGDVGWGQFVLDASDTAGMLVRYGEAVEAAPRDLTANLLMGPPQPGQPSFAQVMVLVDASDAETVVEQMTPIASVSALYDQNVVIAPYSAVISNASTEPHRGQGEPVSRSGFVRHLTPEVAAGIARLLASGATYFFQIRAVGGAVSDVAAADTAYAHRDANFQIAAIGNNRQRLDRVWDRELYPLMEGLYLSFETDPRPDRLTDAFPPATLERLRKIKTEYDPTNLFRDNFNIVPATEDRS
ncbi:alkanesulfonate monooxygenase SsuD/methylene tetrahydromethanopterin reductase-like flavin-dependent oxidoreductase (luciferase family)/FAD/FMN-containing dehydrogenase [Catenuloplanes nepalensis]|uniref:Alkanesulfonate monooxygenase SsuD/methylene tetrahydromethanopterin reductase-like flavin-dependent oxidoreductase (Luciferase family)/FAD/FMN-containing dehydrogenase n=1 Tax=Catenuloplanes nepalensis TaxID=587533 RepID=A0ABT9MVP2_9ACTN|nr:LLM class flavin-dependent oxidoreductase [Catenuloplanes nepalensis]MDP9795500.1 alkanesulfonate monooxygenase SsuD/methylene tetrahydromethanopterin reductase-like flavin-dependent oxidoreductase (luciferase family)/FAD/FMN-containing dehydrogenase [Catenuloplanes nepalensis]